MGFRRVMERVWLAISSEMGRTELLILLGSALIVAGLWDRIGRAALIVPGVVCLSLAALLVVPARRQG